MQIAPERMKEEASVYAYPWLLFDGGWSSSSRRDFHKTQDGHFMENTLENPSMRYDPDERNELKEELSSVIRELDAISLSEIEDKKVQLFTRIESKHLMTIGQCKELVQRISDSYRVLEIRSVRIGRYETMYFDDDSFRTYIQHHNGKGNRYKLRLRYYKSSDETYLEVKKKSNKGSTEKRRMKTRWAQTGFLPEQERFLRTTFPYDFQEYRPVLRTEYDRFTLVSNEFPERITFDTDISFKNFQRGVSYPEFVIGEIKHDKSVKNSPAQSAVRTMGIKEKAFSKYCTGVALLYDRLKHNRFKPNLLILARLFPGDRVT